MRRTAVAVAFVFVCAPLHAQGKSATRGCDADAQRRSVCAVDDSLRVALVRADTARLSRLYADDFETVNYRGVISTKATMLRAIGSRTLRFDTLVVRQRTVTTDRDTAVVNGSMHQVARGAEGAHPLEVNYRRVYRRVGTRWQLVRATLRTAPPDGSVPARYLFAWSGDEDRQQSDFLATIDLTPDGDRYGTIVATAPTGELGVWPHHTEPELGPSRTLFANGFSGNRNVLFDLRDPLHATVTERFDGVAGLSFLHGWARLPNGHVLATFQSHGPNNESPGGIAELDERGRLVRSRSAADSSADQTTLRPYGLVVVPELDRIVVALTYMVIPTWHPLRPSIEHDHAGNQVQVYRLSDLALLRTIRLPGNDGPNEPRLLPDGRTVLVNTGACRLYQVTGLAGTEPSLSLVHSEPVSGCATPVVVGNYWIQSNAPAHTVFALDVSDLANVRKVSSIDFDERQRPHWLASDGARVVVVNEPGPTAERRMWMLTLDRATGRLALDSAFRDAGSARPGLAFDRERWPHGATGTAVPHGTVFGW